MKGKMIRGYLKIKNAIISLLITAIYCSWLVDGLHPLKIALGCIAIFVAMLSVLGRADKMYMQAMKKSADDEAPSTRRNKQV